MARHDIVVLGAGLVGICVALHLQKRGRAVALLDRRGAAEETSYGNAGLIQRPGSPDRATPRRPSWGSARSWATS
jgi:D-amino-acid dehydrogenase